MMRTIGLLLAALALPAAAQSPSDLRPASAPASSAQASAGTTLNPGTAILTAADVDTWLDGYMPHALASGDIAGAEVVVVKDGRVLTQRGFGVSNVKTQAPVDPDRTLFRPGSISKLFTWTAVMQQVQAGKLDLDRDINAYLDFKIPPAFGKPITLRHLMTHTAGFAETAKYLLIYDSKGLLPLGPTLKRHIPDRIYPPGTMPAYSNYGASLAGYIVQRVSGEPFEAYVTRHIFAPIGMTRSSFAQPLPAALALQMSQGYVRASEKPGQFEIIGLSPAGALSATGSDMARFMIAHLADGGPLLDPATTRMMHTVANTPVPDLPGMALGFYHEDRGGQVIIGHAGDTDQFHSDLHLYTDRGVGLYMAFNSGGKDGAAHVVRESLFTDFTDRYFPAQGKRQPTLATARAHGEALARQYVSSRASGWSFLRLISVLGQTAVSVNDDATITVSTLTDPAGVPKRWREIAPWQWREVNGSDRLAAVVADGRVKLFSIAGFAPIIEFLPAPAALNAAWIMPMLYAALGIVLLTALSWPIIALTRRRYRHDPGLRGAALRLHRASRATAWILILVVVGWLALLQVVETDVSALDGRLDPWMRVLQLMTLLGIVGAALTIVSTRATFARPGRWAKLWAVLLVLAVLFLAWFAVDAGLLTLDLEY